MRWRVIQKIADVDLWPMHRFISRHTCTDMVTNTYTCMGTQREADTHRDMPTTNTHIHRHTHTQRGIYTYVYRTNIDAPGGACIHTSNTNTHTHTHTNDSIASKRCMLTYI